MMRKKNSTRTSFNVVKDLEPSESNGGEELDVETHCEVGEKRKTLGPADEMLVPNFNIHAL
jgi:hypothetical protein